MATPVYYQPLQSTHILPAKKDSKESTRAQKSNILKPLTPSRRRRSSRTRRSRDRAAAIKGGMLPEQYDLRKRDFEQFAPEEQQSALGAAADVLLTGAEIALAPLDILGSAARETIGLLATGDTEKYNPLTPFMSPFSLKGREDGRELLRDIPGINQLPMFSPDGEDTWMNFWAGVGVELLTDPLFYFNAPIAAIPKIGRKLYEKAMKTGVGKATQKAALGASKGITKLAVGATPNALKPIIKRQATKMIEGSKEVGKRGREMFVGAFDRHARGAWFDRAQKFAQGISKEIDDIEAAARAETRAVEDILRYNGFDFSKIEDRHEFIRAMEHPSLMKKIRQGDYLEPDDFLQMTDVSPAVYKSAELLSDIHNRMRDELDYLQEMGLPIHKLGDIPYFPRHKETIPETVMGALRKLRTSAETALGFERKGGSKIALNNPSMWGRDLKFKVGEGGTDLVNKITSDPDIVGMMSIKDQPLTANQLKNRILQKYGNDLSDEFKDKYLDVLVPYVGQLDRSLIDKGGLFATNPLMNMENFFIHSEQTKKFLTQFRDEVEPEFTQSMHDSLSGGINAKDGIHYNPKTQVPIGEWIKRVGLKEDEFMRFLLRKFANDALSPQEASDFMVRIHGSQETLDLFKQVPIEKKFANDLERILKPYVSPKENNPIYQFLKDLTTVQKLALTGHHINFHVRNFTGAHINNALMGNYGETWREIIPNAVKAMRNATSLMRGDEIKGISQWDLFKPLGMTDRQATDELLKMIWDSGVLQSSHMLETAETLERASDIMNPLYGKPTQAARAKDILRMNDKGRAAIMRYLREWGSNASDTVEASARLSPMLSMIERDGAKFLDTKYFDIDEFYRASRKFGKEAKDRVTLTQVDYKDLTPFEKDYARIAFPFYSFAKGMTKAVAKELWDKPGGKFAQFIRMQARAGEQDERDILTGDVLPDYLRRGGAIELNRSDDGTSRVLSSFGLMHEQPIEALANPGAQILGMLNPAGKFFLESAMGRSTFFDEPLSQLTPNMGRTLANIKDIATGSQTNYPKPVVSPNFELLVQSSPLSRYISTARTITDKRKWDPIYAGPVPIPPVLLNTLTGVKISDVNAQRKSFATRDVITQPLVQSGARILETVNVPRKMVIDNYQGALLSLHRKLQKMEQQKRRDNRAKSGLFQRGL